MGWSLRRSPGQGKQYSQVDRVSYLASTCRLCGSVGSAKGQWPFLPFFLGESCPPASAMKPDTSVTPCMPLVHFKMLLQCWSSEGVSLKNLCGFFKRNYLGLQKFLSLTQSLQPEVTAADLPGTGPLTWGGPGGAGTPSFLLNFSLPHVGVGTACSSPPLLAIWMDSLIM